MLAGPVSKARTSAAVQAAGSAVTLAMPPRLSSTRFFVAWRKRQKSSMGTSGAPWPPAARSAGRKSLTTGMRRRSASSAGSPICEVQRIGAPRNFAGDGLVVDRLAMHGGELRLEVELARGRRDAVGVEFAEPPGKLAEFGGRRLFAGRDAQDLRAQFLVVGEGAVAEQLEARSSVGAECG